jgi:GAF domain
MGALMPQKVVPPEPATRHSVHSRARHQYTDSGLVPVTPRSNQSLALQRPDHGHALNLVMEAVRLITSAMGAAVALTDTGMGLRCYASAGDAPRTGCPVPLEGTLTGECFRTGQVITADENRQVDAFTLPTYTILLLPIRQQGDTIGILGLFWRESRLLSESTIAIAQAAASMVSIALETPATDDRILEGDVDTSSARTATPAIMYVPEAPRSLPAAATGRPGIRKATPSPTKQLYGLPCANCGAYFVSDESSCPVCSTKRN